MDDLDKMYLDSQSDGRTVIETGRLVIRELVRKNAAELISVLDRIPESYSIFGSEFSGLFTGYRDFCRASAADPKETETPQTDAPETLAGSLIAGDISDQYRFFGYGLWGIFPKAGSDRSMIGLTGLKNGSASQTGEICYCMVPEVRRQGYAYEACLAVIKYARECGFTALEARTSASNLPSLCLLDKLNASGTMKISTLFC